MQRETPADLAESGISPHKTQRPERARWLCMRPLQPLTLGHCTAKRPKSPIVARAPEPVAGRTRRDKEVKRKQLQVRQSVP